MILKQAALRKRLMGLLALLGVTGLIACAAEVGSERWCETMKEKDKGDWTFEETADFARHCVFREGSD